MYGGRGRYPLQEKGFDGFGKSNQPQRSIEQFNDFGLRSIFHSNLRAHVQTLASHERLPGQLLATPQQQDLNPAAAGFTGVQPGRNDARSVKDQQIPGMQIVSDVAEEFVFQVSGVTMQDQHTRRIARLERGLRDGGFG
jgi:hypothetical protein